MSSECPKPQVVHEARHGVSAAAAGVPPTAKPSHTTSQDWPRAGLQPEGAQPHTDAAEMEVNKYEGGYCGCGMFATGNATGF